MKSCKLALEHNPHIWITVQEFWLPHDRFNVANFGAPHPIADRNARSLTELRKQHTAYFASIDEHVQKLNEKFNTKTITVTPVGLPMPTTLAKAKTPTDPALLKLLQELD